ncbi:hypothetical protein GGQ84_000496 [Desulfitispora alkaliphila]|uniref:hypothetical protein n=1 Tax=Desulfitispora alkaliphila TaxID=622674 RepID=UPI003D1E151A
MSLEERLIKEPMRKKLILEALKREIDQEDDTGNSQWVMAVAVAPFERDERTDDLEEGELPTHTARVIIKTDCSPYVDGTDVYFHLDLDKGLADCQRFEYLWASYEPKFHGGTVVDALNWTYKLADLYYLKLDNPSQLEVWLNKLEKVIQELDVENLADYSLKYNELNLCQFYQSILEQVLQEEYLLVTGREEHSGSYILTLHLKGRLPTLFTSKAWYNLDDVKAEIVASILRPLVKSRPQDKS